MEPLAVLIAGVILVFILLNAVAFRHAWRMTHFLNSGVRTPLMEELSNAQKAWLMVDGLRVVKKRNEDDPARHGLPFRTMRIATRGGVTVEVWHIPHRRPRGTVILFPGYTDPKAVLIPEAMEFHLLGYETYLTDFPAAGGSSGHTTTIGYEEAEDVAVVARRLRTVGRPLILFGKSMGAVAIMRAVALLGTKANGLILECPFSNLATAIRNRFAIMGVPPWPLGTLIAFWAGVIMGYPVHTHSARRYALHITTPALHIYGEHDRRVTPKQSKKVYRALAGEKYAAKFPESGHTRFLEDNPRRWRRAVAAFLNRAREAAGR